MLKRIYFKKNETFDIDFFDDIECKAPFDFKDVKNIYIELEENDITPLLKLHQTIEQLENIKVCVSGILSATTALMLGQYIVGVDEINRQGYGISQSSVEYYFIDLKNYNEVFKDYSFNIFNIKLNFSKYIPEDNAVLFLNGKELYYYFNNYNEKPLPKSIREQFYRTMSENHKKYKYCLYNDLIDKLEYEIYQEQKYYEESDSIPHWQEFNHYRYLKTLLSEIGLNKIIIFLPYGTQAELQKANEVAKELKEKYGVEEVNLFVLHCFRGIYIALSTWWHSAGYGLFEEEDRLDNIKKLITTNSTGILEPQDSEKLQVIDCFDIFNDHLKSL